MQTHQKVKEIFNLAKQVIPGGVNSPIRAFQTLGIDPILVEKGKGDVIQDVDGNSYIDFCMGFGPLILGHAHPLVIDAAFEAMCHGNTFGLTTPLEVEMAKKIIQCMPSSEKVRFVNSGTEAVMTAMRLARGYTGKERIVKFDGNYHGHSDALLLQAGSGVAENKASSKGVPSSFTSKTISLPYNDIETFLKVIRHVQYEDEIAAVIVEPIAGNMGLIPAKKEFLEILRKETQRMGALLIMDEVITGFRIGLAGAQGLYGIQGDLTIFGKIIGGGFPIGAVGGKQEIMDHLAPEGDVYQAGTFSGNPIALAAGLATLNEVSQEGFYEHLQAQSDFLLSEIETEIQEKELEICLHRVGSMFSFFFGQKKVENFAEVQKVDQEQFKKVYLSLLEEGIFFPPSPFETAMLSSAHTFGHLEKTKDVLMTQLSATLQVI